MVLLYYILLCISSYDERTMICCSRRAKLQLSWEGELDIPHGCVKQTNESTSACTDSWAYMGRSACLIGRLFCSSAKHSYWKYTVPVGLSHWVASKRCPSTQIYKTDFVSVFHGSSWRWSCYTGITFYLHANGNAYPNSFRNPTCVFQNLRYSKILCVSVRLYKL